MVETLVVENADEKTRSEIFAEIVEANLDGLKKLAEK